MTQVGAVAQERLAATQPYSIDMPTIGAERLSEEKTWGLTMFDHLACRIAFRRLRYDGDFTPIGLGAALQQPGNLGGMNWGSVSVDEEAGRVFLNDIRIPSVFRLIPRDTYDDQYHDDAGHGPAPQRGTPYGMETEMWESPLGIPCNQPPYGTITAIDLKTQKIAWQIPAGTAAELGPMRFKLNLRCLLAFRLCRHHGDGGRARLLRRFSGSLHQGIRCRGRHLLWQHPLPISASATPMTYVSPEQVVSMSSFPLGALRLPKRWRLLDRLCLAERRKALASTCSPFSDADERNCAPSSGEATVRTWIYCEYKAIIPRF